MGMTNFRLFGQHLDPLPPLGILVILVTKSCLGNHIKDDLIHFKTYKSYLPLSAFTSMDSRLPLVRDDYLAIWYDSSKFTSTHIYPLDLTIFYQPQLELPVANLSFSRFVSGNELDGGMEGLGFLSGPMN